jgi:hypothetical protein
MTTRINQTAKGSIIIVELKIICYPPLLRTMLWVLHIILMSPMICGSIVEETTALIHIRSTLKGRYSVRASWKQSDDCCSWERVRCNNGTRVVDLNLSDLRLNSTTGGGCWNLNLAIFSAFHELQQLDLSYNQACLQSFLDVELLGLGLGDIDDPSFMFTTTSQYSIVQSFTFSTKGSVRVYSSGFLDLMFGIDLSANMLSGEIPFQMGNLSSVKSVNLSNNFFTGQIPATFAGMRAIESLDLSHNGLSGQIPCELTKLWSLEVFSVAYNNLSGCMPWSGQFSTFSTDSYVGNVNLHSTCVSDSSPIKEEAAGASYQEEDPVLYTMSVTAFLLAFFATVSIMLFHSFLSFGRGTDPINFFDVISSLQR